MSNQADVADVVQDVFLRVAQTTDTSRIEDPKRYLFRTAINVLNDRWRRQQVRSLEFPSDAANFCEANAAVAPDRLLISKQTMHAVLSAIERLPKRTQHIFILRAIEEMRSVEIAKAVGISRRAVEKHYATALLHIRRQVADYREI